MASTGRSREAKVSVLDRGFIFGDGVYEVVRLCRPLFRFDEHMARLAAASPRCGSPSRSTPDQWLGLPASWRRGAAEQSGAPDQLIYSR
jgi:D-alanine transaminase